MRIFSCFLVVFIIGCAGVPRGRAPAESYSHLEFVGESAKVGEIAIVEVIKRARIEDKGFFRVYLVASEPTFRAVNELGGFDGVEVLWYKDLTRQNSRFWKDACVLQQKGVWLGDVPFWALHFAKEKDKIAAAALFSIRYYGEGQNAGYLVLFSKQNQEWLVAEVVKEPGH